MVTSFQNPQRITIRAWADDASSAPHTSTAPALTPGPAVAGARGTSVQLSIPLDGPPQDQTNAPPDPHATPQKKPRREPIRRDSLKRREALLKGKEGSRRRQRWENAHLLSNPWAQPPLPSDWYIAPTHRKTIVPYFLAPLWDAELSARAQAKEDLRRAKRRGEARKSTLGPAVKAGGKKGPAGVEKEIKDKGEGYGLVPKELRRTLKKAKGARGLLRELEDVVRGFVAGWEGRMGRKEERVEGGGGGGGEGKREEKGEVSSDEEIVFVGRGGRMKDVPASPTTRRMRADTGGSGWSGSGAEMEEVVRGVEGMGIEDYDNDVDMSGGLEGKEAGEKLVFGAPEEDRGARFGRWLVHSIAQYYGLKTWSVTVGDPARREAYVAIKRRDIKGEEAVGGLPKPLYVMA